MGIFSHDKAEQKGQVSVTEMDNQFKVYTYTEQLKTDGRGRRQNL